jgi:hypothetical protein
MIWDDARLILGDHHGQRAGLSSRDAAADRHVDDGDTGRRATGLDLADERPADSAGVDDRLQSLAYTERSTHTRARGRKKRKISDQFPTKAPLSAYLTRVQMWDLRSLFSNKLIYNKELLNQIGGGSVRLSTFQIIAIHFPM